MIANMTWTDAECEECSAIYKKWTFDCNSARCPSCENTYQLRRIADALEYWVGMQ